MAKSTDHKFLNFVKEERDKEWFSLRSTARKRIKENPWETCDKETVSNAIKKLDNPLEALRAKYGLSAQEVSGGWISEEGVSIRFKKDDKILSYHDIKDELIEEMKKYAPKYPKLKRSKMKDSHLLVIDLADVHIGKLADSFETGEEYNNQIAVQRVKEWVQGILDKAGGFPINRILVVWGNDVLHFDTPKWTTTWWTVLDTDGTWYSNYKTAQRLLIEVLEQLIAVADVDFLFCPSNHDFMSGFMLCDSLSAWFNNNKNITFDVDMKHRKYYDYGSSLICVTHGDGAKQADMPLLMASETPLRSQCDKRYIYSHHLHHKVSKDYIGVTFETLRSPSWTDGWHHRNWFTLTPKALEWFIHHPEHGQIARITHLF